jgi:hypothetical protein
MNIAKIFNDKCKEFLKDMKEVYPENPSITSLQTQLRIICTTSEKFPIESFIENCMWAHYKVKKKDEDFFLGQCLDGTVLESLNLKEIWKISSKNTKLQVWKYLELFFMLADKYQNKKVKKGSTNQ